MAEIKYQFLWKKYLKHYLCRPKSKKGSNNAKTNEDKIHLLKEGYGGQMFFEIMK